MKIKRRRENVPESFSGILIENKWYGINDKTEITRDYLTINKM